MVTVAFRSRRTKLPPIYDEETRWYQGWYFDLRLEEELARSKRHSIPLSLIVILAEGRTLKTCNKAVISDVLLRIALRKLRRSDIPGLLKDCQYAMLLPHTNAQQAAVVEMRLSKAFEPFRVVSGIASFPKDGGDPQQFLAQAMEDARRQSLFLRYALS